MKLSCKAMAVAFASLWGGALLFVGIGHAFSPDYGQAFLDGLASVYPGFPTGHGVMSVIGQTLYGAVDGGIGGALFAFIYNAVIGGQTPS